MINTSSYALDEFTSIEVAHQGAHLCSWKCYGEEQLYLSPIHLAGKAIRGGIPIIFPQFEEFGDGPRHGYARMVEWEPKISENALAFSLKQTDESWPFKTNASIEFTLRPDRLTILFEVSNDDQVRIAFTTALHSYLRVNSIHETRLTGLQGLDYWTNAQDFALRQKEENETLTFAEKTDRIYFHHQGKLVLTDTQRELTFESTGFDDVVVWNPWSEDAKAMADLPDDDYQNMLCVEPARVNHPVVLEPGESWQGLHRITHQQ